MPPDVTGPGGAAGGVPIPPTAPVRPAPPSRAVVPVERAGPRAPTDSPLGRSGVALGDLIITPDLLETREAVAPVAMELGLETARRQLLQRLAAESLESLDAVWARAVGSEEGWYLRAGALTVLGHPHEGDKVAGEGLAAQPQSLALRLIQSVARALVGDLSGARAVLYRALDEAPDDPVLLAQQAVVLARQGHADDAGDVLVRLTSLAPEHPALLWARAAVRIASTDRTRSAARAATTDGLHDDRVGTGTISGQQAAVEGIARPDDAVPDGDLVATAFRRLGSLLRTAADESLGHEARTLLRACSAGGTLASACTPSEAHAARQVLSELLTALRGDPAVHATLVRDSSPLGTLLQQMLPLLRSERRGVERSVPVDAERVLRRHGAAVPIEVRQLIGLLIEGEGGAHRDSASATSMTGGPEIAQRQDDAELGPLVPVRLGLALLGETAASRAIDRQQVVMDARGVLVSVNAPVVEGAMFTPTESALAASRVTGDHAGAGWGAARAAADQLPSPPATSGAGAALPVILLTAVAVGAAMNGAAVLAAAFGAVGLWLALRSRTSRGQTP